MYFNPLGADDHLTSYFSYGTGGALSSSFFSSFLSPFYSFYLLSNFLTYSMPSSDAFRMAPGVLSFLLSFLLRSPFYSVESPAPLVEVALLHSFFSL